MVKRMIDNIIWKIGESLTGLNDYRRNWNGDKFIYDCLNMLAVLCVELQFSSLEEIRTVDGLNEIIKCFQIDSVEAIKKAIPAADAENVRTTGGGIYITLEMGDNIPKLLYYIAIFLRIAARKYQRLQEPERARMAAVTAALYIQACADLMKQYKEIANAKLNVSLPTVLFDQGPVPNKYDNYVFNIDALVEREFELGECNIERMGRKIKAQIAELS